LVGTSFEKVELSKDLGVNFNNKLAFDGYINEEMNSRK